MDLEELPPSWLSLAMTSLDQETLEVHATRDEQSLSREAVRPLVASQTSGGSNHYSFGQLPSLSDVHGPQVSQASNQAMSVSGDHIPRQEINPYARLPVSSGQGKEFEYSTMDNPYVFTQQDGLGGRTIDGILYEYGKGEEVKIMCFCQKSVLTAAEFVKHAGGNDVDQPLKHIVFGQGRGKGNLRDENTQDNLLISP
ncbi:ninja-family protein AFP1-like [Bidens hawaiensis]|uniref:ninja-family protein AFP1-like n=1 Tax=Bidens hawaiensis TaxID=980011 RepID=UPI00404B84A4